MSRRATTQKKLVERIAERTGEEIAAACREEIAAERAGRSLQDVVNRLRGGEAVDHAE